MSVTDKEPSPNPAETVESLVRKHTSIRSAAATLAIALYHEVADQRLKHDILKLLTSLAGPPPLTKPKPSKETKKKKQSMVDMKDIAG